MTIPFNPEDELEEQLHMMRVANPDFPLRTLKNWINENVAVLVDKQHQYDSLERIEYRLKVQGEIMRMVEEGTLDKNLQYVNVGTSDVKEASDVRD